MKETCRIIGLRKLTEKYFLENPKSQEKNVSIDSWLFSRYSLKVTSYAGAFDERPGLINDRSSRTVHRKHPGGDLPRISPADFFSSDIEGV